MTTVAYAGLMTDQRWLSRSPPWGTRPAGRSRAATDRAARVRGTRLRGTDPAGRS
jgi:hypothetical protein